MTDIELSHKNLLATVVEGDQKAPFSIATTVGWGCRIHRLHLCRGATAPNKYPVYDTKQSDGEVIVMLEL